MPDLFKTRCPLQLWVPSSVRPNSIAPHHNSYISLVNLTSFCGLLCVCVSAVEFAPIESEAHLRFPKSAAAPYLVPVASLALLTTTAVGNVRFEPAPNPPREASAIDLNAAADMILISR